MEKIMNKKQKIEKCRKILYSYHINETIDNEEDLEYLLSIFENHSEWELKKGVGIQSISIMKNIYNTCFQLNRIDGSSTDISFMHSISTLTQNDIVKKACRSAISHIILNFIKEHVEYGVSVCPITNEILTRENINIDHYDMDFNSMFRLWVAQYDIKYLHSQINETEDNIVITYFVNESIKDNFIDFHNKHCKLRAVTQKANASILKSRR